MARNQGNLIRRFIDIISGNMDLKNKEKDPLLFNISPSAYTDEDRNKTFFNIVNDNNSSDNFDPDNIRKYISTIMNSVMKTNDDNAKIFEMIPDISQSANIVISSIISPNELKNNDISMDIVSNNIKEDIRKDIAMIISNYFNKTFKLKDYLDDWILKALYTDGAKIIMLLPQSKLDDMYKNKLALSKSTENFDKMIDRFLEKDSYEFGMEDLFKDIKTDEHNESDIGISLENMIHDMSFEVSGNNNNTKEKSRALEGLSKKIVESVEIIDRPENVKRKKLKAKRRQTKNKLKIQTIKMDEKTVPIMSFDNDTDDISASNENPIYIDIISEACIPLHIPGSAKDHLGYFIVIDKAGYPVDKNTLRTADIDISVLESSNKSPFANLFKAYGLKELKNSLNMGRQNHMAKAYKNIMEGYLNSKLDGEGFGELSKDALSNLNRYMFANFLKGHKTRFLYVPKEFIVYMAFDYHDNAIGKSKLENIKFFLSLRITMVIAKMMSDINNSIDHKNIEVQFGEGTNKSGREHLAIVQQISDEYLKKNMMGFSLDPSHIMEALAKRSIHVKASGIAGIQDFSVTSETGSRQHARPDDTTMEDLRNQTIMGLDVPPSALNALGEHEYSRSVASSSLIFARKIKFLQEKVCRSIETFIRMYIKFSSPLQKEILAKLKNDDKDKETDDGTVSIDNDNDLINDVLNSLEVYLPEPTVLANASIFQNFREFFDGINQVVDSLFPDELAANNSDISDMIPFIRSMIKKGLLDQYIISQALDKSLLVPSIKDMNLTSDNVDYILEFKNLARQIKDAASHGAE